MYQTVESSLPVIPIIMIDAGCISYPGLPGHVKSGRISTPSFKSRYCKQPRDCELVCKPGIDYQSHWNGDTDGKQHIPKIPNQWHIFLFWPCKCFYTPMNIMVAYACTDDTEECRIDFRAVGSKFELVWPSCIWNWTTWLLITKVIMILNKIL